MVVTPTVAIVTPPRVSGTGDGEKQSEERGRACLFVFAVLASY